MVDLNIPREQACTQHNALNPQRNMRSGQSGWTKHTPSQHKQHSSNWKPNVCKTLLVSSCFSFFSCCLYGKIDQRWCTANSRCVCWQANGVPAGRPVTVASIAQFLPTTQREWHNRPFISVSTSSHCNSQYVLHRSVWVEISKGNREHNCVTHNDKQNLL